MSGFNMDSRQLESSSSESELDLHDVEEKIRDILPNIKRRRLASFLEYLQKMGVESVNDLVYINERDISQTLTPIEARRLLDHLNCRPPVESGSQNRPVKATLELDDSSSSRSSSSSATDESSQSSVEIAVGNPFPSRSSAETGSTRVPWQKMPRLLMAALEAKRRPAPSLRKEMIRIIVDDLDKPSTSLPRTKVLRALSSEIVQRFPDSFIDELGGEKVGSGYDSLLSQLVNRVDNISRPSMKRGRFSSGDEISSGPAKKKRDSYGCINWQPISLPKGETVASQVLLKDELKALHASEPHTDKTQIMEKMSTTYATQRAMLNKANCALLDVIEDWPYLFDEKFMLMHFKELVGTDIMHKVQESFKDKIPKILRFLKQHSSCLRNKQLQDTLQQLEAAVDVVGNKSPQVIGLITVLCAYFGEDRGCHILSTEVSNLEIYLYTFLIMFFFKNLLLKVLTACLHLCMWTEKSALNSLYFAL
ncbi:uncharacterized protein LOC117293868 [Asterias rubens]|uniref:uncharacterized protein LOC117293868 n=1 Tax=Asterias rubens TaxID=7604 RepID=UPI0014557931|nr:uncharacterized protein LOC117293868 [Asterias rubens]